MLVAVLIIYYRTHEHMSLHDSSDEAWTALLQFVDSRWTDHCQKCGLPTPHDAENRVARFFADPGDSYVIGDVDASDIAAHIEALRRD